MDLEAILLTGGASRRMGVDKANLLLEGEPLAARIARELKVAVNKVTVLGTSPLDGCAFQPDAELHAGPAAALCAFRPEARRIFVASCDMPLFRAAVVSAFNAHLAENDAIVPRLEGRLQPTCALYRAQAIESLRRLPTLRLMDWLARLEVKEADESMLRSWAIEPNWTRGANTMAELQALIAQDTSH